MHVSRKSVLAMQSFNGIAVFNTAYLRRHFVMLALMESAGKVPARK